ncbi:MAG TPA: CDP-alcohol phosphatidyltransferase family protein [Candidatus Saccharimonadales bacterium]|nr:CDP-alcohol phosphatidyltransferase family protein [Candidatus Saccharimonadales bacterium]
MDLHRSGLQPDWQHIFPIERNVWQRIAAATYGIITPANAVSALGGGLVAFGLWSILGGNIGIGLAALGLGRLADIADGYIAARTHTKSPVGEVFDSALDKLAMIGAIIVFVAVSIVPLPVLVFIGLQHSITIGLSIIARLRGHTTHPSAFGKIATGLQWAVLLIYVGAELLRTQNVASGSTLLQIIAGVVFLASLALGIIALSGYAAIAATPPTRHKT